MKTVTKNESAVFGFGGWCCLMSGLFMFCAFSDRVPIILAWLSNEQFFEGSLYFGSVGIVTLIVGGLMYLFRQAKKVVRAPEENWQEKINTGFEE
ncbi:TPA: hypothetical protein ACV5BF_004278, partial [Enterobacter roggenkampii]